MLKAQGTYDFPWGTGIGANIFLASGTPQQRYLRGGPLGQNVLYEGRGSEGRTPTLWTVDLLAQHAFRLRRSALLVEVTALNLFD